MHSKMRIAAKRRWDDPEDRKAMEAGIVKASVQHAQMSEMDRLNQQRRIKATIARRRVSEQS